MNPTPENQQEWKTIDTAPKGAWILLTGGEVDDWDGDDGPLVVVGKGYTGRYGLTHWRFACYDSGYYGFYESPTHWQPLPPPPCET